MDKYALACSDVEELRTQHGLASELRGRVEAHVKHCRDPRHQKPSRVNGLTDHKLVTLKQVAERLPSLPGTAEKGTAHRLLFTQPSLRRRMLRFIRGIFGGALSVPEKDPGPLLGLAAAPRQRRAEAWLQGGAHLPQGCIFERALIVQGEDPARVMAFDVHEVAAGRFRMQRILDGQTLRPLTRQHWALCADAPPGEHLLIFYAGLLIDAIQAEDRLASLLEAAHVDGVDLIEALKLPGEFYRWPYLVN